MAIVPFRIDVPQPALEDLAERLRRTRWPGAIAGGGWAYGIDDGYARELADGLAGFDWRTYEAELNAFPHFKIEIDGLNIHFLHIRGKGPSPTPLLLTHGWPSSFVEWLGLVGPLADPAAFGGDPADCFDVIVPSLPGYGFSDIPEQPGMTPRRIADLWARLMGELGYPRFAAHGCDWGSYITSLLGLDHPDRVMGLHMGSVSLSVPSDDADPAGRTPEQIEWARRRKRWLRREAGYSAIQATKPQTLAYGLNDSPCGLAAWIGEKWRAWSDQADPSCAIPAETLLGNIAIYWFTGTINSACRLYYESDQAPVRLLPGQRVEPPAGFFIESPAASRAKGGRGKIPPDAGPRRRAEAAFNVRRWCVAPRGGHFPALETPDLLVGELRDFFRDLK